MHRQYESTADEKSARQICGMEWKIDTVNVAEVRDMLQQTQFRPSFKAGNHISVDCTLIAASRYAIEKQQAINAALYEALEEMVNDSECYCTNEGVAVKGQCGWHKAQATLKLARGEP